MVDKNNLEMPDLVAVERTASTWREYIVARIDFFLDRPSVTTRSERLGWLILWASMLISFSVSFYVWLPVFLVGFYLLFRVPKWSDKYQPWTLRRVLRYLLASYIIFLVILGTIGLIGLIL